MKLTDLSHNAPFILPPGFSVFRVQRKVPMRGTVKTGPFLTPPVHVLANRFDIAGVSVGYVATDPLTSLYETMARRDVTIVSQGNLRDRWLLELQSGSQLNLLDLRPHAHHWPVLYGVISVFGECVAVAAGARRRRPWLVALRRPNSAVATLPAPAAIQVTSRHVGLPRAISRRRGAPADAV